MERYFLKDLKGNVDFVCSGLFLGAWNPSGIYPTGPQGREETKVHIPVVARVGSVEGEAVCQTIYSMFIA